MSYSDDAYNSAADKLGVEARAVKAVADVESAGQTFWTINGEQKPAIRLESHWFGKLTGYVHNDTHPQISSRKWDRNLAASTRAGAWDQYAEAASLDESAAIQACSWGAFQIMGFHWKALGYASPQAFRDSMNTEAGQLDAFARFVKATPAAHDALRRKDWRAFENAYNGGGFGGAYADKMAAAYERIAA
jgi:hypothetical protein